VGKLAWEPIQRNGTACSKNAARSVFLSGIVKETTRIGHERVFIPVDFMVSILDAVVVGAGNVDDYTYQK
jgi:hypothetical protein